MIPIVYGARIEGVMAVVDLQCMDQALALLWFGIGPNLALLTLTVTSTVSAKDTYGGSLNDGRVAMLGLRPQGKDRGCGPG